MNEDERLTIKQIAKELDIDERTVRRWINLGHLPYVGYDLRGRKLVRRIDLDEYVAKRTSKKEDTP